MLFSCVCFIKFNVKTAKWGRYHRYRTRRIIALLRLYLVNLKFSWQGWCAQYASTSISEIILKWAFFLYIPPISLGFFWFLSTIHHSIFFRLQLPSNSLVFQLPTMIFSLSKEISGTGFVYFLLGEYLNHKQKERWSNKWKFCSLVPSYLRKWILSHSYIYVASPTLFFSLCLAHYVFLP